MTNKIHFNIYDVFYSQCSHLHVSVAIATIFRVTLLLQEYKLRLAVSPLLHKNLKFL
jgi:hypothetical protein